MAAPLTKWHDEHVRFGQILDMLEAQLIAFRAGPEPDYELMRDIVEGLHSYSHRFHHPREDAAFALIAVKEPDLRMIANRLEQEHRVIAWAGQELLDRLAQIAEDVIVERSAVEAAASTYLVYYRHHLATEDAEILPRAARHLTDEDWAAVAAVAPAPDLRARSGFDAVYQTLLTRIPAAGRTP